MSFGVGGAVGPQEGDAQAVLEFRFERFLRGSLFEEGEGIRQEVHVDERQGFVQPVAGDVGMAIRRIPEEGQRLWPPSLFLEGESAAGDAEIVVRIQFPRAAEKGVRVAPKAQIVGGQAGAGAEDRERQRAEKEPALRAMRENRGETPGDGKGKSYGRQVQESDGIVGETGPQASNHRQSGDEKPQPAHEEIGRAAPDLPAQDGNRGQGDRSRPKRDPMNGIMLRIVNRQVHRPKELG